MSIEADRQAINDLPYDVEMLASLRESARLIATHYSTQIEGNRLTQIQVNESIAGARLPGRERDVVEVRNYYRAIEEVELFGQSFAPISESEIRRVHALVMGGRPAATPYRDGQNVIRDSTSGSIVYMPPEAPDVPELMKSLVAWLCDMLDRDALPIPVAAALAHYQYATIHPYYDGNGRTARLLTSLILHRTGYGLNGIYSLEEYYANNLTQYYDALSTGPSHNYYFGRVEADVTDFVSYFCLGMADSFASVRSQAAGALKRGTRDISSELRELDARKRALINLFARQSTATSTQIARHLGLSQRTVVGLSREWLADGFLVVEDASRKNRSYRLAARYEALVVSPSFGGRSVSVARSKFNQQ